ncbi:MAG TPA: hypothetical protein DD456_12105 [Stenotrophomonas sp.]|nr:hypothetical protein [Stenotrophomonas sp.]
MVRAILAGRKTQTRRVVKVPPAFDFTGGIGDDPGDPKHWGAEDENAQWWALAAGDDVDRVLACPFGQSGDRLWVRETTVRVEEHGYLGPVYLASEDGQACLDGGLAPSPDDCTEVEPHEIKLRPAIHMPRSMCRLVLEITDVRVERLQAITETDVLAEGVERFATIGGTAWKDYSGGDGFNVRDAGSAKRSFRSLWTSTGADWDSNPWVWVISFKRVDGGQR